MHTCIADPSCLHWCSRKSVHFWCSRKSVHFWCSRKSVHFWCSRKSVHFWCSRKSVHFWCSRKKLTITVLHKPYLVSSWYQLSREILTSQVLSFWNQTKCPIHSMVAERGRTNWAKFHTPTCMWKNLFKTRQNSNRSSNFCCNWTSVRSNK